MSSATLYNVIILTVLGLFVIGTFSKFAIYGYLAWFKPHSLRRLELGRLEKTKNLFPRLRGIAQQRRNLNADWWLWTWRIVTIVGLGFFVFVAALLISTTFSH